MYRFLLIRANPGSLGSINQFIEEYEKVIEKGQKQDATKRELAHARKGILNFHVVWVDVSK